MLLGLAATVDQFKRQVLGLAADADLKDEFLAMFALREDLEGAAKLESILALLVSMTGWVQGQIDAMTLEARIEAEAEALARERTRQTGFGPTQK